MRLQPLCLWGGTRSGLKLPHAHFAACGLNNPVLIGLFLAFQDDLPGAVTGFDHLHIVYLPKVNIHQGEMVHHCQHRPQYNPNFLVHAGC